VVQGDTLNRSSISTIVCVPLTSNLHRARSRGNVFLKARFTGLKKDSVANSSQIVAVDRSELVTRCNRLPKAQLRAVLEGIAAVLT